MGDSNRARGLTSPEEIQKFFKDRVAPACCKTAYTIADMLRMIPAEIRDTVLEKTLDRGYNSTAWMFREAGRLLLQEYASTYLPHARNDADIALNKVLAKTPTHFVHRSKDAPAYIAYTPNETYGLQDRQIRTTVGRYLKKTYPELTDQNIRSLSEAYRYHFASDDILWATTKKEMEHVYTTGPHSCMAHAWDGCSDRYGSQMHPSAAYANLPWFRLAYLKRDGKINARCLTYINPEDPEDKRLIRPYGDPLLHAKLIAIGYRQSNLMGALIHKIGAMCFENTLPVPETYVCPYIDDQTSERATSLRHSGLNFFEIGTDFSIPARSTTGLVGRFPEYTRNQGVLKSFQTHAETPNPESTNFEASDVRDIHPEEWPITCDACLLPVLRDSTEWSSHLEMSICDGCVSSGAYLTGVYDIAGQTCLLRSEDTVYIQGNNYLKTEHDEITYSAGYVRLTDGLYPENTYVRHIEHIVTNDDKVINIRHARTTYNGAIHHALRTWYSGAGLIFTDGDCLEDPKLRINLKSGLLVSDIEECSESDLVTVAEFIQGVEAVTHGRNFMDILRIKLPTEQESTINALHRARLALQVAHNAHPTRISDLYDT